jgi:hypothetical protein
MSNQPDDREPTPERQAELRAAYDANVAAGRAPYEGVEIRTRGEVQWILLERGWLGEQQITYERERVNLSRADLGGTNLSGTHLRAASLYGTRLRRANLSGVNLRAARMDAATVLVEITLDTKTWLGDVVWDGAQLTRVDWTQAPQLGDEQAIATAKTREERLTAIRDAARAYGQLATVLRDQGMNDEADGYAERAQVLRRRLFWQQRQVGRWAFWVLLDAMAGYGYRLSRILIAYALIVGVFAAAFLVAGVVSGQAALTVPQALDALQVSLNAIHGRVFFAQYNLDTVQSWLATAESIVGIVVEGVFVAMLVQRFFAR